MTTSEEFQVKAASPRPSQLRVAMLMALLVGIALSLGCANGEIRLGDPFDRQLTFEEAQHRYTVLMRWSKLQSAKNFVAKEKRAAFLKRMKALSEARFTGFETEEAELDDERQTATVRVIYTLYMPSSPYEVEIAERQVWSRNGLSNVWNVDSTFGSLNDVASN